MTGTPLLVSRVKPLVVRHCHVQFSSMIYLMLAFCTNQDLCAAHLEIGLAPLQTICYSKQVLGAWLCSQGRIRMPGEAFPENRPSSSAWVRGPCQGQHGSRKKGSTSGNRQEVDQYPPIPKAKKMYGVGG